MVQWPRQKKIHGLTANLQIGGLWYIGGMSGGIKLSRAIGTGSSSATKSWDSDKVDVVRFGKPSSSALAGSSGSTNPIFDKDL